MSEKIIPNNPEHPPRKPAPEKPPVPRRIPEPDESPERKPIEVPSPKRHKAGEIELNQVQR